MKTQRLVLTLLAFIFVFAPQSPKTAVAERNRQTYFAKLISPKPGEVLMPGTIKRIEWTANFPDVDLNMCETEIMLSVDGGQTYTFISSQRDPQVHYFNWLVPRSPTKNAVLDIRFGCLGIYAETSSLQLQSSFVISSMD